MFRRLLVPLDGSEASEVALPYAERIAARLNSELVLLHVFEDSDNSYRHMHEVYMKHMVNSARRGIKAIREKSEKAGAVRSVFVRGHPAEQIVEYAEKRNIDLVIMTTHGWTGFRRWMLGSVADRVARSISVPVALIPIGAGKPLPAAPDTDAFKKLLVPLDGSKDAERLIPYVEQLASRLDAEVVLLQVVEPFYFTYSIPGDMVQLFHTPQEMQEIQSRAQEYLERSSRRLTDKGIRVGIEIGIGTAADEIIKVADNLRAFVVMSTHGRSGVTRWAFGSTADRVLHGGNTPLLLVRTSGAGPPD